MAKRVTATDAKNNFGGLLEEVAGSGRVEIVRHGRVVAVVLSPRELQSMALRPAAQVSQGVDGWRRNHMIPARLARAARRVDSPATDDDD